MQKISRKDSIHHARPGVDGYYYMLPEVAEGLTVVQAEFTGEHGERTIGETPRIYFVLEGSCTFEVNKEKFEANTGDCIVIPPLGTYNLWPTTPKLKVMLYMELIDI